MIFFAEIYIRDGLCDDLYGYVVLTKLQTEI